MIHLVLRGFDLQQFVVKTPSSSDVAQEHGSVSRTATAVEKSDGFFLNFLETRIKVQYIDLWWFIGYFLSITSLRLIQTWWNIVRNKSMLEDPESGCPDLGKDQERKKWEGPRERKVHVTWLQIC